ncbi:hypothetical protein EV193_106352 [Herbihabitans rhizosphaerae]|uniref:Lipoprotein n=1 Tax=Herbihabitans rhizosphaerae TaxID=1872711 RepID=A0A4Q7KLJ1_9PSEU|nr:hypothetical protein [Herbihabitans rhizosphaerae]RZS37114.1 hypothetical protein EV193_106352 [Herbihabitans rhizosphaerae]
MARKRTLTRHVAIAMATLLATTSLAACVTKSGPPLAAAETVPEPPEPPEERPTTRPAPTTTTTPSRPNSNQRGNVPKRVGEQDSLSDRQGNVAATFTLTKIEKDARCTNRYASKPENGHFVVLTFEVNTSQQYSKQVTPSVLSSYEMSVLGPDGVTETNVHTAPTYGCRTGRTAPYDLAPASKYVFEVVLDVKNTTGILQYRPILMRGEGGWEWTL